MTFIAIENMASAYGYRPDDDRDWVYARRQIRKAKANEAAADI